MAELNASSLLLNKLLPSTHQRGQVYAEGINDIEVGVVEEESDEERRELAILQYFIDNRWYIIATVFRTIYFIVRGVSFFKWRKEWCWRQLSFVCAYSIAPNQPLAGHILAHLFEVIIIYIVWLLRVIVYDVASWYCVIASLCLSDRHTNSLHESISSSVFHHSTSLSTHLWYQMNLCIENIGGNVCYTQIL